MLLFYLKLTIVSALKQAKVDEDGYLLYRLTEHFHTLLKDIYEKHKANKKSPAEQDFSNGENIVDIVENGINAMLANKDDMLSGKVMLIATQLGINVSKLSKFQLGVLVNLVKSSESGKKNKRRK